MGTIISQALVLERDSAIAMEIPPRNPPQVIIIEVLDPNEFHFFKKLTNTFTEIYRAISTIGMAIKPAKMSCLLKVISTISIPISTNKMALERISINSQNLYTYSWVSA